MTIPIPLPIHVGTEYTVNARGSIFITVRCNRCLHVYSYEMVRSEPGGGFSILSLDNAAAQAKAQAIAELSLQRALEKGRDPVPCPACGTYQPDMVAQVKGQHLSGLDDAALLILTAAGIASAVVALTTDLPAWMILVTAGPVGVALIALRRYLGSRHEPNCQSKTELRKEIGRQRVAAAERSAAFLRAEENRLSENDAEQIESAQLVYGSRARLVQTPTKPNQVLQPTGHAIVGFSNSDAVPA